MPLTAQDCIGALHRLGLEVSRDGDRLSVVPPPHRFDLAIEEDLIEEVVRVIGYDKLPTSAPLGPITGRPADESHRSRFAVRRLMAALGYQETINFSFVDAQWEHSLAGNAHPIQLLNPIASQMSVMRSSLMASLLQVVKFNLDRKASRVRVFEIGRVFLRDSQVQDSLQTVKGFAQPMHVAGMAYGPAQALSWNADRASVDFYDVKADVAALFAGQPLTFWAAEHPALHPGRTARIACNGHPVGWLGELHPKWRQQWDLPQAPVVFELSLDAVLTHPVPVVQAVPRLQAVERDLAIVVDELVSHSALMQALWSAPVDGLLQDALLFDVYRPQKPGGSVAMGEKSLAVRLVLQSKDDVSLTDAHIETCVQNILAQLSKQLNAKLRT
jgi:phenylalanyl-tRNA synthetase beta chain